MNKKRFMNFAAVLFTTVAVICIAVTVTLLARPLYYFDIENLRIAETLGIPKETVKLNYDVLIDYNLLGGPSNLEFPTFGMSESGRIHFEEVKEIFTVMQIIAIIALISFAVWLAMYKKGKATDFEWMKLTGVVTAAIALVVGIVTVVCWEAAFAFMHMIFFRNDYWIFDAYTDPIIKILPEEFFMHCGLLIAVLTFVQITVLRLIYRRLKNDGTHISKHVFQVI